MYVAYFLEEDKEEVEGTVLGGGGDEVSIMPVVSPVGRLVSHHSVIFRLLVHLLNPLILPFLSLYEYTIFKSISRKTGGGSNNSSNHRRRSPGMRSGGS